MAVRSTVHVLEYVPVIGYIESKFDAERCFNWIYSNLHIAFIASAIYVLLVLLGQHWMSKRPRYDLRNALRCWNVGLVVFSLCGVITTIPNLIYAVAINGFEETVCKYDVIKSNPHFALWSLLYLLSKIVEFGDTAFVILRKSPLQFLHWYHHITVLLYTWYAATLHAHSIGYFFGAMNYSVHVVMYSYFAIKAFGFHVPSKVALMVTILQISQMFGGLYINYISYKLFRSGRNDCWFNWNMLYSGIAIYGSYAILFMHFFYKRYVAQKDKTE